MQSVNYVLVVIYLVMLLSFSVVSLLVFYSSKKSYHIDDTEAILLTVLPAVFWSCIVFIFLYKLGPVEFSFFTDRKAVNTSPKIAVIVSVFWFVFEYFGNTRNIEEKKAEVMSFAGKRRGQSAGEGFSHIPGIWPLFIQVTIYIFFRFTTFWSVVRGFNVSPIIFVENAVVYTSDNQAIVLRLNCKFKIADPYAFDDSLDDNAKDEEGKRLPVISSAKEFLANAINSVASRNTLDDLRDDWKETFSSSVRDASMAIIHGLQIDHVSFRFISFDNDALQKTFQSFAGRNIRRGDISAKAEEVRSILQSLKEIDSSYEKADAERLWESFTKNGRGAYQFKFF